MRQPGRLLASGRDCDVFEYGERLVLRRARDGRSQASEAEVMEHVRTFGYPVPVIDDVSADGSELVMERVDGPSMIAVLGRRPWLVRRHGALLAGLHRRLHEIPAPSELQLPAGPGEAGEQILHLDLHPLNVLIGPRGPVVIDWTNAARGEGAADVALTWLLLSAAEIPGGPARARLLGTFRGLLLKAFLEGVDREGAERQMRAVAEWKASDRNIAPGERAAMERLVTEVSGPG